MTRRKKEENTVRAMPFKKGPWPRATVPEALQSVAVPETPQSVGFNAMDRSDEEAWPSLGASVPKQVPRGDGDSSSKGDNGTGSSGSGLPTTPQPDATTVDQAEASSPMAALMEEGPTTDAAVDVTDSLGPADQPCTPATDGAAVPEDAVKTTRLRGRLSVDIVLTSNDATDNSAEGAGDGAPSPASSEDSQVTIGGQVAPAAAMPDPADSADDASDDGEAQAFVFPDDGAASPDSPQRLPLSVRVSSSNCPILSPGATLASLKYRRAEVADMSGQTSPSALYSPGAGCESRSSMPGSRATTPTFSDFGDEGGHEGSYPARNYFQNAAQQQDAAAYQLAHTAAAYLPSPYPAALERPPPLTYLRQEAPPQQPAQLTQEGPVLEGPPPISCLQQQWQMPAIGHSDLSVENHDDSDECNTQGSFGGHGFSTASHQPPESMAQPDGAPEYDGLDFAHQISEMQGWLGQAHHRSFDEQWEAGQGLTYVFGPGCSVTATQLQEMAAAPDAARTLYEQQVWHDSVPEESQAWAPVASSFGGGPEAEQLRATVEAPQGELLQTNQNYADEIQALKAELEFERSDKDAVIAEANAAIQHLEAEALRFAGHCDELTAQVEHLRSEVAREVTSEVHGAFARVRLERQLRCAEYARDELSTEVKDLRRRLKSAHSEKHASEATRAELQQMVGEATGRVVLLLGSHEGLRRKLSDAETELATAQRQVEVQSDARAAANAEAETVRGELAATKAALAAATEQAQTLSSERDTAHADAARLAEELASVRRERVSLFGEVARLRGDVLLRRAEAGSAIRAQISLQREVTRLADALAAANARVKTLGSEVTSLCDTGTAMEAALSGAFDEVEGLSVALVAADEHIIGVTEEAACLRKTLANMQAAAQSQVLKLEGERDSAVEEGAAAQSAAREESERFIIELAAARQDNNALQARVEGLCEALDRSRGTGQADAAGRADLDHQVTAMQGALTASDGLLASAAAEVHTLSAARASVDVDLAASRDLAADLQAQVATLRAALAESRAATESHGSALEATLVEVATLRTAYASDSGTVTPAATAPVQTAPSTQADSDQLAEDAAPRQEPKRPATSVNTPATAVSQGLKVGHLLRRAWRVTAKVVSGVAAAPWRRCSCAGEGDGPGPAAELQDTSVAPPPRRAGRWESPTPSFTHRRRLSTFWCAPLASLHGKRG